MGIEQMVRELMQEQHANQAVSESEYKQWAAGFVFEALRNQRYGQSFCRKFNIQDNILYYSSTVSDADRYIRENYIK